MRDTCPECGSVMLDDTPTDVDGPMYFHHGRFVAVESIVRIERCDECLHWEDAIRQPDGTIVVKGHAATPPGWRTP